MAEYLQAVDPQDIGVKPIHGTSIISLELEAFLRNSPSPKDALDAFARNLTIWGITNIEKVIPTRRNGEDTRRFYRITPGARETLIWNAYLIPQDPARYSAEPPNRETYDREQLAQRGVDYDSARLLDQITISNKHFDIFLIKSKN